MSEYTAPLTQSMDDTKFEFDEENILKFSADTDCATCCMLCPWSMFCYPCISWCWLKPNRLDKAKGQHLRVTATDIHYTRDPYYRSCRCEWTKKGRVVQSIPLDQVTNVTLEEAGGSTWYCCCIPNILHNVYVQTAAGDSWLSELRARTELRAPSELRVQGLKEKDARAFRDLVLSRRRK